MDLNKERGAYQFVKLLADVVDGEVGQVLGQ